MNRILLILEESFPEVVRLFYQFSEYSHLNAAFIISMISAIAVTENLLIIVEVILLSTAEVLFFTDFITL